MIDFKNDFLKLMQGDCRELLKQLPDGSVNCCVTSPPYWGLRDYGHAGQIGQEKTPAEFVETLVQVFREVRRVLREDGTLWLNLGDSYCSTPPGNKTVGVSAKSGLNGVNGESGKYRETLAAGHQTKRDTSRIAGLKPKDLIGIPWRVALALQADGWWLRSDIIWAKQNCMPESVTDRPTRSHEYIFLLTKSPKYYYDAEAIKEPCQQSTIERSEHGWNEKVVDGRELRSGPVPTDKMGERWAPATGSNKRDVWTVAPANYKGAHFATYPPALIKPCILAGCPSGGVVLDPFGGSGTTGVVALELGRRAILMELNPEYAALADKRCAVTYGMDFTTKEGK